MDHYIFSDASFDPKSKIAICGILKNGQLDYDIIWETTNIKAEIYAFQMSKREGNSSMVFVTDCDKVYKIATQQNLNTKWVKGHKPTKDKDTIDKQFAILDKFLRKTLRELNKAAEAS